MDCNTNEDYPKAAQVLFNISHHNHHFSEAEFNRKNRKKLRKVFYRIGQNRFSTRPSQGVNKAKDAAPHVRCRVMLRAL